MPSQINMGAGPQPGSCSSGAALVLGSREPRGTLRGPLPGTGSPRPLGGYRNSCLAQSYRKAKWEGSPFPIPTPDSSHQRTANVIICRSHPRKPRRREGREPGMEGSSRWMCGQVLATPPLPTSASLPVKWEQYEAHLEDCKNRHADLDQRGPLEGGPRSSAAQVSLWYQTLFHPLIFHFLMAF